VRVVQIANPYGPRVFPVAIEEGPGRARNLTRPITWSGGGPPLCDPTGCTARKSRRDGDEGAFYMYFINGQRLDLTLRPQPSHIFPLDHHHHHHHHCDAAVHHPHVRLIEGFDCRGPLRWGPTGRLYHCNIPPAILSSPTACAVRVPTSTTIISTRHETTSEAHEAG